jgi:hypothetical protein
MKIAKTIILFVTALFAAGFAYAHETAQPHTESNLGTGLSSMVRGILGESDQPEDMAEANASFQATMQAKYAPAPASEVRSMSAVEVQDATMMRIGEGGGMGSAMSATMAFNAIVATEEDALNSMRSIMESDTRVQSLDVSDGHVRLTFAVRSKILNLIPKTIPITAGVYASGETELSYPWYASMAKHVPKDFNVRIESSLAGFANENGFTPQERIDIMHTMYAAFVTEFGPAN